MSFPSVSYKDLNGIIDGDVDIQYRGSTQELIFKSVITGHSVMFAAYITDYSQQFSQTWNSEEVYGRADPIATYQGTKRSISLAWTIPAKSVKGAKNNMRLINSLVAMLYPGYSSPPVTSGEQTIINANSIARSPLIKIKYANLIQDSNSDDEGLLGYVDGFTIQPELEMGVFDDAINIYPKVIAISCNFNVLHQHDIGFNNENEWLDGESYKKFVFGDDNG
jgi:hypothetical protein